MKERSIKQVSRIGFSGFRLLKATGILAILLTPAFTMAGQSPWVNILNVGGQGDTIYLVLSQSVTSDAGCSGQRLVLSPTTFDVDQQKRIYAAALAAISTGKQMMFYASGCYNGTFPSMIGNDYWWMAP